MDNLVAARATMAFRWDLRARPSLAGLHAACRSDHWHDISWECTAIFLEAIAIGLFLYGWKRMKPWVHWTTGLLAGMTGFVSASSARIATRS